ncbi:MAG: hypothetical protein KF714_04810 [Parvibaculum sp.]|nr:hypothetical protein [Parvibaculum sp.]
MGRISLGRMVLAGLVLLHAGLLVWALMGLAEWIAGEVPWPAVANPLFPRPMLLFHWLSVIAASTAFLAGLTLRWRGTPIAVALGYAAMGLVCLIETMHYLVHDTRWLAMAAEYTAYLAIGSWLFLSETARSTFRRAPA